MKVFIEQGGQEGIKNVFDKQTKALLRSEPFHLTYPYPYGYILDTLNEDGDELDCYIITDRKYEAGDIVEAEPIGMIEYFDNGLADHKILCALIDELAVITDEVKAKLKYFSEHFYDDRPELRARDGRYLGKLEAEALVRKLQI